MNMDLPSLWSFHGHVGLALIVGGVAAALLVPALPRLSRRTAGWVAVAFLAFQAFHFLEHLIQLTYWFMHPSAPPYMTPWALDGVHGLAAWFSYLPVDAAAMAGGMEGLHLVGNVIFLVGILALDRASERPLPGLRTAAALQGIHVAEHVLLTGTLWAVGTPIGISTLFGVADGYSWAGTLRVWFHFVINLGGSVPAAMAFFAWRARQKSAATEPTIDLTEPAPIAVS